MKRSVLIRLTPKARFQPRGDRASLGNAVRDSDPKGSAESQTALDHPVKLRSADTLRVNRIIMKRSMKALLVASVRLTENLDLVGFATYGRRGSEIATVEACLHEIAHHVFTGPKFEQLLLDMSPQAANRHEASALRVESAVLDHFSCEISLRTLWKRANWKLASGNKRPTWTMMISPLTTREKRCVCTMTRRLISHSTTKMSPLGTP